MTSSGSIPGWPVELFLRVCISTKNWRSFGRFWKYLSKGRGNLWVQKLLSSTTEQVGVSPGWGLEAVAHQWLLGSKVDGPALICLWQLPGWGCSHPTSSDLSAVWVWLGKRWISGAQGMQHPLLSFHKPSPKPHIGANHLLYTHLSSHSKG